MLNPTTKKITLYSFILSLLILSLVSPTGIKMAIGSKKITYQKITTNKLVALTFDDGPEPRFTVPILDILKEYHAPATFFMVGNQVIKHPDIAKRIIQEGHEVGNHTMNHLVMTELVPNEVFAEIKNGKDAIKEVTNTVPHYYRSPKGLTNAYVEKAVSSLDMKEILWTVTIENHDAQTPEAMANRVLSKVQPGFIILLHDGRLDRTKTVKSLPLLLRGLQEKGYKVVSLSELLSDTTSPGEDMYYDEIPF